YTASLFVFFFQAEDGIRDFHVTGVQTCALPIYCVRRWVQPSVSGCWASPASACCSHRLSTSFAAPWEIASPNCAKAVQPGAPSPDRKSTRLNSSHVKISYAVFCLKKKKSQVHSL